MIARTIYFGSISLLNKVSDKDDITKCLEIAAGQEGLTYTNYERSGLGFINFNTERAPMNDPAVRQAIAYLTDRDGIVQETLGGYGMRAQGYFGLGQWMYLVLNGSVGYPGTQTEDGEEADEELWEHAVSMRQTEPADVLGYCAKWLEFQKRFMETLPALPIYSNVYFDFYPQVLHDYMIRDAVSWPQAILGAYLAEYIPAEEEPAGNQSAE
ncbi:MAG: hypothetical protein IKO25_01040 [Clostridia bacterium]|nr:hypothetical protein [Clostridia bacterium]